MDAYDLFKLQGLEAFAEFRYYKGETENPYDQAKYPIEFKWWGFERNYFDNHKISGQWKTFSAFLDHWIREIAAPGSGYNLNNGNWWLEEYDANAPF